MALSVPLGARPVVAVVPFGARGSTPRAGAWARQIAARLVERFVHDEAVELRSVFLIAPPERAGDPGYLVFGSSPDNGLASELGASLGATHALTGTYREEPDGARALELSLVSVARREGLASMRLEIAPGTLHETETTLARWLVQTLGVTATGDLSRPAATNESAYAALLEGMDEEVTATLLRKSDPTGAGEALRRALSRYLAAVVADAECAAAEERLLVLAAESLERGDLASHQHALENMLAARPRSWRAHYLLGQLRAEARDTNGAIVAFEHAQSLRALPDADLVRLAELYARTNAPAPALAHLRRIGESSDAYGAAQRLLAIIAFERGDVPAGEAAYARALAASADSWELRAGRAAAAHGAGRLEEARRDYEAALALAAPAVVRLQLSRVLLALGDAGPAAELLEILLGGEAGGEVAAHARRLRFGIAHPDLERELETAGVAALEGDVQRLDAAEAVFERALAAEPALWEAHFGIGLVARQRGDALAGQRAFGRVLEIWPEQPDALHELGVALLMGREIEAALGALERAAALRPGDSAYLADAGFAQLRAGNLGAARRRLEEARRLDAQDPVTRAYLDELQRIEAEAGRR